MVTSDAQHPISGETVRSVPCSEQAMHEPLDITTIIFALLAVFVVWKLRSVLGTRTGHEKQRDRSFSPRTEEAARQSLPGGNVIRLPGAPVAEAGAAASPKPDADRWKDLVEPD